MKKDGEERNGSVWTKVKTWGSQFQVWLRFVTYVNFKIGIIYVQCLTVFFLSIEQDFQYQRKYNFGLFKAAFTAIRYRIPYSWADDHTTTTPPSHPPSHHYTGPLHTILHTFHARHACLTLGILACSFALISYESLFSEVAPFNIAWRVLHEMTFIRTIRYCAIPFHRLTWPNDFAISQSRLVPVEKISWGSFRFVLQRICWRCLKSRHNKGTCCYMIFT